MRKRSGFTIVELLVVVSIIALLVGILLPAIGKARDQARLSISRANLRQLGQASAAYASEWQDRQVTLVNDNIGRYGNTMVAALGAFQQQNGMAHPGIAAGWGPGGGLWGWWFGNPSTYGELLNPISFSGGFQGFGYFRSMNVKPFTEYLNGKSYDPIFWAPKDRVPLSVMDNCFDQPFEFVDCYSGGSGGSGDGDGNVIWPTYCWSPAALYNPDVFDPDGFIEPITLNSGHRVPSMSQANYSDLKTHMLEHHWLQNTHAECNPNFAPGNYEGCEPYYFNHGRESVPMTLFYDGHVEGLGTMEAQAASSRAANQSGGMGLWHTGTPFGTDGYFISEGWDTTAATSFHILTTDGITGRDKLGG
ncbi:MAG: type II secretion system protein [Planctomycetota bacterium]|jgi:prepilin-type N-terminal cleavage/methylation domain-containing protein